MKYFRLPLQLVFLLFSFAFYGQGTIKTMVYNLLDFPSAYPNNRELILKEILMEYEPDIFMVCELQSEYGANLILDFSLNSEGEKYAMAPFVPSQSGDPDHQQLIFYRKNLFTLENTGVRATPVRDINYYTLKLHTTDQDTDPVLIHVFVTHLKSSQGNANKNLRLEMVEEFLEVTRTMDPDSYVLFAGDMNFYTHTEPAYQLLTNENMNITMADPIDRPGSWHNNIAFQDIHTQSTRIYSGPFGAGAGGGLDDRFDFIFISDNMLTDPKLRYIPETYMAFGNNGNCYDNNINSPDCDGLFDQTLRNHLYNMSDHLPVVMEVETNKQIVLNTANQIVEAPFILESTLVKDVLKIRLGANFPPNTSFMVYNTLGQKLIEVHTENKKYISIPVESLSAGFYFLRSNLPNSPAIKFARNY